MCGILTVIYKLRLSDIQGKEGYLFQYADSSHREKAAKFFMNDDRLRCLAAGYLIKQNVPFFSEELVEYTRQGKPYLPDKGIAFNVSHGGNFIVLAVSNETKGIGVDVEPIREIDFYRDILAYAMTEREQLFVGNDARNAVFIWTRKESLYKCIGEGIKDFSELPEVISDRVLFLGNPCQLHSREEENHFISISMCSLIEKAEIQTYDVVLPQV